MNDDLRSQPFRTYCDLYQQIAATGGPEVVDLLAQLDDAVIAREQQAVRVIKGTVRLALASATIGGAA